MVTEARVARLTLKFGTRSRLWADVVHSVGERVFVETGAALKVGARVEIDVVAPALAGPLTLEGDVVEVRAAGPIGPPGVYVRLTEAAVTRCRELLNAQRNDGVRTTGRSEPRADGHLPARVVLPEAVAGCALRGFSASGITLNCSKAFPPKLHVELMVRLGADEVALHGTVLWCREELNLLGLQLEGLAPEMGARIVQALSAQVDRAPGMAKVVIADDDEQILELVSRVVSGAGHTVMTALRGDDALELIRREQPRLAFLDILMPGLDGLEVCKALRADAGLLKVKVVLMSAMSEQRLDEAAKSVGADGWVMKPTRIATVRAALEKYLR